MDELYKALETIRQECIKNNLCLKCPLRTRNDDGCSIRVSSPYEWELRGDEEDIPRLFK